MITDKAKRKIALFIKDMFVKANIGAGGNASFPNSNELDVPILSTNATTSNSESDDTTIDFAVSVTGANLQGNTIRELGIFSETMPNDTNFDELRTTTSYSTETTMLTRVNFEAIGPFTSADTLDFTFTMEVE
tara:strand:+ start:709 stop:1107 length:399 start_codon:yes stop_codon:yes gene_type:complete